MIEVLALAGAITQISGAISSSIQAGRDVSDLLPHFGKLARLDTEIHLEENGRHKGPLGRLTSSQEEGFAIAQAKMKHKECMDNLRSMCRLYGPPGMWNLVVQEQASARQRHKEQLEAQAKARDQMFWGISLGVGAIVLVGGIFGMYWGLDSLVNG